MDIRKVAMEFANNYYLDIWTVDDALALIYPDGEIPNTHLYPLAEQLEAQTARDELKEETIEVALALVKPDGFTREVDLTAQKSIPLRFPTPLTERNYSSSGRNVKTRPGSSASIMTPTTLTQILKKVSFYRRSMN